MGPLAFVLLAALTACSGNEPVGVATATARPVASPSEADPSPTAEPTPEPTATPTPAPEARAPEIASFNVVADDFTKYLMVRIHNPNEDVGLLRSGFELTAVAEDGAIIDVFGTEGLPGASCCTIYRLPPGGDFGVNLPLDASAPAVGSVELAVTARWTEWADLDVPESDLSDVNVVPTEYSGPQITGRVTTPSAVEDGPFNIWIVGFVESAAGMVVISGSVDCVSTADARAFAIDSFLGESAAPGPYTLESVVAYTTTVPGVTDPTPGC